MSQLLNRGDDHDYGDNNDHDADHGVNCFIAPQGALYLVHLYTAPTQNPDAIHPSHLSHL